MDEIDFEAVKRNLEEMRDQAQMALPPSNLYNRRSILERIAALSARTLELLKGPFDPVYHVILDGDLGSGFAATGPFLSDDEAVEYAKIHKLELWEVFELEKPSE